MDPISILGQIVTTAKFVIQRLRAIKDLGKDVLELVQLLERVECVLSNGEVQSVASTQKGLAISTALKGVELAVAKLNKVTLKMQEKGFFSKFCTASEMASKLQTAVAQLQTTMTTLTTELSAIGTKLSQLVLQQMQDSFNSTSRALAGMKEKVDCLDGKLDGLQVKADDTIMAIHSLKGKLDKLANAGTTQSPSPPSMPVSGRLYKLSQLEAGMQGFASANKIGEGGFGSVYKGKLDGVAVAIKVMSNEPGALQGQREFMKEVNILSSLHHPHIVQLLGSCPEHHMLVYELAEGGSLEDRLLTTSSSGPGQHQLQPLPWQSRVRIAQEVAAALQYLHTAAEPIVHMDINPRNILLTRHDTAKLGDVGLARFMPNHAPPSISQSKILRSSNRVVAPSAVKDTEIVGSFAYIDPEYMSTLMFSPSSDVFALGMVMLQLLTGMDVRKVHNAVEDAVECQQINKVIDSTAGDWPQDNAATFAVLALQCVESRRRKRPNLGETLLPRLIKLVPVEDAAPRKPQAGATASQVVDIPDIYLCPITHEIMMKPAMAADGHTYEWSAIETWLMGHNSSPLTNQVLRNKELLPNHVLRSAISDWLLLHPEFAPGYETGKQGHTIQSSMTPAKNHSAPSCTKPETSSLTRTSSSHNTLPEHTQPSSGREAQPQLQNTVKPSAANITNLRQPTAGTYNFPSSIRPSRIDGRLVYEERSSRWYSVDITSPEYRSPKLVDLGYLLNAHKLRRVMEYHKEWTPASASKVLVQHMEWMARMHSAGYALDCAILYDNLFLVDGGPGHGGHEYFFHHEYEHVSAETFNDDEARCCRYIVKKQRENLQQLVSILYNLMTTGKDRVVQHLPPAQVEWLENAQAGKYENAVHAKSALDQTKSPWEPAAQPSAANITEKWQCATGTYIYPSSIRPSRLDGRLVFEKQGGLWYRVDITYPEYRSPQLLSVYDTLDANRLCKLLDRSDFWNPLTASLLLMDHMKWMARMHGAGYALDCDILYDNLFFVGKRGHEYCFHHEYEHVSAETFNDDEARCCRYIVKKQRENLQQLVSILYNLMTTGKARAVQHLPPPQVEWLENAQAGKYENAVHAKSALDQTKSPWEPAAQPSAANITEKWQCVTGTYIYPSSIRPSRLDGRMTYTRTGWHRVDITSPEYRNPKRLGPEDSRDANRLCRLLDRPSIWTPRGASFILVGHMEWMAKMHGAGYALDCDLRYDNLFFESGRGHEYYFECEYEHVSAETFNDDEVRCRRYILKKQRENLQQLASILYKLMTTGEARAVQQLPPAQVEWLENAQAGKYENAAHAKSVLEEGKLPK